MNLVNKNITLSQIFKAILILVVVNFIAGYGIVLLGTDIAGIYNTLNKPYFAPPTWVFGVVWGFNCLIVAYGILLTINLSKSLLRAKLLTTQALIVFNYSIFQYLSFGSPIIFDKLLPSMFFWPTFSMLILTIIAMNFAYRLDTESTTFKQRILSGKSIFATFWSLLSWLLIASALGLYIWLKN